MNDKQTLVNDIKFRLHNKMPLLFPIDDIISVEESFSAYTLANICVASNFNDRDIDKLYSTLYDYNKVLNLNFYILKNLNYSQTATKAIIQWYAKLAHPTNQFLEKMRFIDAILYAASLPDFPWSYLFSRIEKKQQIALLSDTRFIFKLWDANIYSYNQWYTILKSSTMLDSTILTTHLKRIDHVNAGYDNLQDVIKKAIKYKKMTGSYYEI